ncbi:hypothetical protein [Halorubrum sp. F4]|uniref:hypothetical protein n=1 Tax=Halorubrum sp. F4 TaxID=2989715 RepID=UPI00247FC8AA|nr:hypothetical protein [Halorubrum sp. F4]
MRSTFIVLLTLVVATPLLAGGVAAQENSTNETVANATAECTETINNYTAICSAELDGSDVVIDIHTEGPQTVTVTEAFRRGSGVLEQRRVRLQPGRNTVRLTVTVDGGSEGVTINAGQTLYQKEIKTSSSIIVGPFTSSDVQASGLGGALGVALTTLYMVARRVYGRVEQPERIA